MIYIFLCFSWPKQNAHNTNIKCTYCFRRYFLLVGLIKVWGMTGLRAGYCYLLADDRDWFILLYDVHCAMCFFLKMPGHCVGRYVIEIYQRNLWGAAAWVEIWEGGKEVIRVRVLIKPISSGYHQNTARIANAVQVTLWLSVSHLNRCLCSHCSHCSQCPYL